MGLPLEAMSVNEAPTGRVQYAPQKIEQRSAHAPNTMGNFCFDVTLSYPATAASRTKAVILDGSA